MLSTIFLYAWVIMTGGPYVGAGSPFSFLLDVSQFFGSLGL
ncbi:MAG: hypothetical protein U1A27_07860 [Phycisphaerae bacterium]